MPVYEYTCLRCGAPYDVFHKGREIVEDVVCPSCGSAEHKKLMSVPGLAVTASGSISGSPGGNCCGGTCGASER
jgi:putative FmdB family regulatory protein